MTFLSTAGLGHRALQAFDRGELPSLRAGLKPRPVRAPGLQSEAIPAASCRPRALTRRWVRVYKPTLIARFPQIGCTPQGNSS
jgi:hypothetical protein